MRTAVQSIGEDSLAIRAAWLHYAGGLTQADVAKKLRIPSVKAHRLISRANQAGAVKFIIDGDIAECVALENRLTELYDLSYCEVTLDLHDEGLPLRALGIAGAGYLRRELERGQTDLIGFGHGRTLAAVVGQLPHMSAGDTKFVSLLGGLNRNYAANPHDVMHRLADKTGAEAYFMPVPFFANSQGDREVLLAQHGVRDVLEMAARSSVKLVGVGTVESDAYLVSGGMIELAEIEDIKAKGGIGELLGHFFNETGAKIETPLTDRTMSVGLAGLKDTQIVAVAGGEQKSEAIRSALRSGYLSGLITDERTANALVNQHLS
ncbi:MAG: sugar-binding transcriptional regulator [Paracoccaceae bacterium]